MDSQRAHRLDKVDMERMWSVRVCQDHCKNLAFQLYLKRFLFANPSWIPAIHTRACKPFMTAVMAGREQLSEILSWKSEASLL